MGRKKFGSLGSLLTGKTLEAYTRLSEEDASNYVELKNSLLKRYHLTAEKYHGKFRKVDPKWRNLLINLLFVSKLTYRKMGRVS